MNLWQIQLCERYQRFQPHLILPLCLAQDPEEVRGPPGTPTLPTTRVPPPLPPRRIDAGDTHTGSVGNGFPSEGSPFGNDDASEGVDPNGPGSSSFSTGGDGLDLLPDLFVPGRIVHIYRQACQKRHVCSIFRFFFFNDHSVRIQGCA